MGKGAQEAIIRRHYGGRRLHISKKDDLEQKVQEILDGDLGSFCWSLDFEEDFILRLFAHGFLPICTSLEVAHSANQRIFVLLPKLHRQRCILRRLHEMHVDRGARKRSKQYRLTVDAAFERVVEGCIEQHGESWLWPPMRQALSAAFQKRLEAPGAEATAASLHSIELWKEGCEEPVAGELGYTCGAMYTSLTGFRREDGTGTVQMLALVGLLIRSGFQCWDLGMQMDYKNGLGAEDIDRCDFVALQRLLRAQGCRHGVVLPSVPLPEGLPAAELFACIVRAKADSTDGKAELLAGDHMGTD